MGCACKNQNEWVFEYQGVEYAFDTHAAASTERRRLGATSSPLRPRKKKAAV